MTPRLTSPDGHYTLELNLQGGCIQRARFADFEIFYNAPWQSNGGRDYFPWNGRNYCVGIEPIASAFDLPSHGETHARELLPHLLNVGLLLAQDT